MPRLSRRRLLSTSAASGLHVAVSGCKTPAPPPPPVRFEGQRPEIGHQLRSSALRARPIDERRECRVLVIGAGASGMAAAWRFARAGLKGIQVLELEADTGGTARSGSFARSSYPQGAHYLPSPHVEFKALRELLRDLGIAMPRDDGGFDYDPGAICAAPLERHYYGGRWYPGLYPHAGQSKNEAAQWEAWRKHLGELDRRRGKDGRRLFCLPVSSSSEELRHLDRISMAEYLDQQGFDSWRLRWVVDYACRDDYGLRLEQCSAFAGLHHFLSRGLEEQRDGYILSWPEGNHRLVRGMAEFAQTAHTLHREQLAFAVDPDRGEVRSLDLKHDRVIAWQAEQILWAGPRFILGAVLPRGRDPLPWGSLRYTPWLVANVELARTPAGFGAPLCWDNVPIEAPNLGYVVANHGESPEDKRRPGSVISFYTPLLAHDADALTKQRKRLLDTTPERWREEILAQLEQMHPGVREQVKEMKISRWGHAMIRPEPGLLFGAQLRLARQAVGRVLPCATDVQGLPLFEEAFAGGVAAAEQVLTRLGTPEASMLG